MTRAKQGSIGLPHFFTDVRIADKHGATETGERWAKSDKRAERHQLSGQP